MVGFKERGCIIFGWWLGKFICFFMDKIGVGIINVGRFYRVGFYRRRGGG